MTARHDAEERAWATDVARAFLAPAATGAGCAATEDGPLAGAALVVAMVPLPRQASGAEALRGGGGGEEQEEDRDG